MLINLTDNQVAALDTLIDLELGASESSRIDAWRDLEAIGAQLDSGVATPVHIVLQRHVEDDIAIEVERAIGPFASDEDAEGWIGQQGPADSAVAYEAIAVEPPPGGGVGPTNIAERQAEGGGVPAMPQGEPTPSCPAAHVLWHGVMQDDSDAPQPAGYPFPTAPVQVEQGGLEPTSLGIVATLNAAKIEVVVELRDGAIHVLGYTPADDDPAFSIDLTAQGVRADSELHTGIHDLHRFLEREAK